jgi:hypothetical protein
MPTCTTCQQPAIKRNGRFRGPSWRKHVVSVGLVLSVGGLIWAASAGVTWALFAATLADGVLALAMTAAVRTTRLGFVAVALLGVSFGLGLQLVQRPGWTADQSWPWLVLAIGLAVAAEVHLRRTGENRRPLAALVLGRSSWQRCSPRPCSTPVAW